MTGGLLEKNILFLKGNYFEFFKFLTEYNAAAQKSNLKFSIKIQDSDAAIVECFVNDDNKSLYFEGKYNPKLTFERLIKSEYSENLDAYFVMEFLGGYEIKKIIEIMKNNKIHIVYLIFYPEIFYEIIRFIDISFLKNFNVDFVFGKNKIEFNERLALINLKFRDGRIIVRQNVLKILKERGDYLEIVEYLERKLHSKNFAGKFGGIVEENIWKNKEYLKLDNGIKKLKTKKYKNTALLVGAGSSVDYHLAEISEYRKKLTIFAVDAALPILLAAGIIPDFVITIDPQKYCLDFFENACDLDFVLVFTPYSYYEIIKQHKFEKYYIYSYPHKILEGCLKNYNLQLDEESKLSGGAGVSLYAHDLIAYLNFEKIIIVGQDFGFIDNHLYSKNSIYYKKKCNSENKFFTLETDFFLRLIEEQATIIDNIYTTQCLKKYLFEFEKKIIENIDKIKYYHLLPIGLNVRNTIKISTLKNVII